MVMEAGADLVDPGMFLRGCKEPLEQYRECLMKNLKDWNGRYAPSQLRKTALDANDSGSSHLFKVYSAFVQACVSV